VVAECVEDEDVLARLQAMGVGYAQGFGIHQPHPIDAFAE
jgi:EAL domain-containing protein (putative c-di-GMP-specific phosphodiesterase class I)